MCASTARSPSINTVPGCFATQASQAGSQAKPRSARIAGRLPSTPTAQSSPAFAARRQARVSESSPKTRAGVAPTGTNMGLAGIETDAMTRPIRDKVRQESGIRLSRCSAVLASPPDWLRAALAAGSEFAQSPPRMATRGYRQGDEHSGDGIYRCVGTLTILRAATTERELDLMPEGMTID